ncbi:hypothetical protein BOVATA_012460 [Babesia ovata]|uniref:Uncharacterized protein n=1 Tax=Babesia ovata TaxID=189622 RepID=A0A2H6K9T4_9APIC|nr:uncharacterized protein BOVATA_012460 [Babesia ovata]GBE59753.1 hypothetical protein BOVATA_012460 [Babesia ovata]
MSKKPGLAGSGFSSVALGAASPVASDAFSVSFESASGLSEGLSAAPAASATFSSGVPLLLSTAPLASFEALLSSCFAESSTFSALLLPSCSVALVTTSAALVLPCSVGLATFAELSSAVTSAASPPSFVALLSSCCGALTAAAESLLSAVPSALATFSEVSLSSCFSTCSPSCSAVGSALSLSGAFSASGTAESSAAFSAPSLTGASAVAVAASAAGSDETSASVLGADSDGDSDSSFFAGAVSPDLASFSASLLSTVDGCFSTSLLAVCASSTVLEASVAPSLAESEVLAAVAGPLSSFVTALVVSLSSFASAVERLGRPFARSSSPLDPGFFSGCLSSAGFDDSCFFAGVNKAMNLENDRDLKNSAAVSTVTFFSALAVPVPQGLAASEHL